MVPLYKLDKLPRIQKLRKIAKYFSKAEIRLNQAVEKTAGIYTSAELIFFYDAAKLLINDIHFFTDAKNMLNDAVAIFEQAASRSLPANSAGEAQFRRALNNVKHFLLTITGREQADWDFTGSDGRLDPAGRQIFEGMYVYLEDIRSPFNVGAMFRTAESFGVEKIFLSPLCADPHHKRSQRTSMGCIDIVPWERCELFPETETPLMDVQVFALETGGIPLSDFSFPRRGILIAGSEELGVSPGALAAADASLGRVSIPTYGAKVSLNVSVAFGIALNRWAECYNAH
jgi:TrmH family RNA methyltransferase